MTSPVSAPSTDLFNWLFIDMNGFFASAEQHLRPELRGKPVGVVPVVSEGTCIIAASADAKARGIRTGTRVPEARQLCPGIVLVKARPDVYVELHHAIARTIDRVLPIHKAYSIDEWAIRLRGAERQRDNAVRLGRQIKDHLRHDFSRWLSCSVGIAPTRLLAKIASELHKPDGLTALSVSDLPHRLEHLQPRDLTGISRGIDARLQRRGIRTIGQLWELTKQDSTALWGSVSGGSWWAGFHGHDEPEAQTRRRSMSHANVLDPSFRSPEGARRMLIRLISRLGIRLRTEGYLSETLSISVSQAERDQSISAACSLPHTQDTAVLLRAFYDIWDGAVRAHLRPLQVGATVSGLVPASQMPGQLFAEAETETQLSHTMDTITRRWGTAAIYFGSMHGCCDVMEEKIAFGRIPTGVERVTPRRTV